MHMLPVTYMIYCMQEKFEDIKGVIRGHKSKNDRQYNGQKNKDKESTKHYTEN